MASIWIILASFFSAIVNLMTKKNVANLENVHGYLVIYFLFSFFITFLIDTDLLQFQFHYPMMAMGAVAGTLLFLLMVLIAKALENGPPGLVYAFQNSGAVMPSIILFFLFGKDFGFIMTPYLIVGILFIILGLFWASNPEFFSKKKQQSNRLSKRFLYFALGAFALQSTILCFFFWKSILTCFPDSSHALFFISCLPNEEKWFLPSFFFSAFLLSLVSFINKERRFFLLPEFRFGTTAGLFNGASTYLILLGAKVATPVEKSILFPMNAICVIIFCNLWGQKLYMEKVNWPAILFCLIGVILGTI